MTLPEWLERLMPCARMWRAEADTLREEYTRLTTEKLLLQDRLDAALADRNRLWLLVEQSLTGERTTYQMHINQSWPRMGGNAPYPDAPSLPAHAVPKPPPVEPVGRQGRTLPSEVVAQATERFLHSALRMSE